MRRVRSHVHRLTILACCGCCFVIGGCAERDAPAFSPYQDYVIAWDGCLTLVAQAELGEPNFLVATYVDQIEPRFVLWYPAVRRGDLLEPMTDRGLGQLSDKWRPDAFLVDHLTAEVEVLEGGRRVGLGHVIIEDQRFDMSLHALRRGRPPGALDHLRHQALGIGIIDQPIDHYEHMRLQAAGSLPREMRPSP